MITLPTGELFDTETGEYIEREAPKVDMPEADPDTIELPDGRFFNKTLNAFVTGPQVGAKEKVEDVVPDRPKRTRGRPKGYSPKKTAAETAAESITEEEANASLEAAKADNPQGQEAELEGEATPVSTTNGATPAPEDLEDILKSVLPTRK